MGARICKTCSNATTCGNFNCVAAKIGHIECLHQRGRYWDSKTCSNAAAGGHIECLEYAHKHRCPWDSMTCSSAASRGHLECLKYAHEHGCPWDSYTCYYAAIGGFIKCLEYAHEHGCPWHGATCSFAVANGHLECLKYAHQNGAPWYPTKYTYYNKNTDCLVYTLSFCDNLNNLVLENPDNILHIALVIYMGGSVRHTRVKKEAHALIDLVYLLRRMKAAIKEVSATRIQRAWREYMYRPGGPGMIRAEKRFNNALYIPIVC